MSHVEYKPCANAPLEAKCDMPCENTAVVDCQIPYLGTWANLCMAHFIKYGSKKPELVNNLTGESIFITV